MNWSEVKRLRTATGFGLREAVDAVQKYGGADEALKALGTREARDAHESHYDRLHTKLRAEYQRSALLLDALRQIAAIGNRDNGPDWEEIEEARLIAEQAIKAATEGTA